MLKYKRQVLVLLFTFRLCFGHCLLAFMCFAEDQIVPFISITGANGSHSTEIAQEYHSSYLVLLICCSFDTIP